MRATANRMERVVDLWLHDHPGGTIADFERASAPFNAEPGSRHRRIHNQFLNWLNTERVQCVVFGDQHGGPS